MSYFLRLIDEEDKAAALATLSRSLRAGEGDASLFIVQPQSFDIVPGKPFAYWVSDAVRETFLRLPALGVEERAVRVGLQTSDDFRFVRIWWEVPASRAEDHWLPFAKGGAFSRFYADIYLLVNWANDGVEIRHFFNPVSGALKSRPQNIEFFLRPGLTWPLRTTSGLSFRAMPAGCAFSNKGPAVFVRHDDRGGLLALLSIANSRPLALLVSVQLAAADAAARSYEVGVIQRTPAPELTSEQTASLAALARRAWSLKRALDTTETSHAFLLPLALRVLVGEFNPVAIEAELARIQAEIDEIAFDLYGFSEANRLAALESVGAGQSAEDESDEEDEASEPEAPPIDGLLSWAVGVAFGRFDWRLATGERAAPAEPEPFDPLPARSPGMLPEGSEPFHAHAGILVDDPGHHHDLARLVEEVLARVDVAVPDDVRRWLGREFFEFHMKRYSKSRRKAPIYWPLSTASGNYTLWVYYPSLSDQTLYSAVNDFLEPKLEQVVAEARALREKGAGRSRDDEKRFEELQAFELELIELRDALLKLAPSYKPRHDDGVQVSAAPLWSLFRYRPWQKVLRETWSKLEKGDYDWAHLAMSYWPERVREKGRTDKSLAIAHGLEDLYEEPEPVSSRGTKRKGGPS